MNFKSFLYITFIMFGLCIFVPQNTFASMSSGTINTVFYNAKVCHDATCTNPQPGIINFHPTGATPISVDDTTGISGKAWGNELGWIEFKPTGAGVTINTTTGELSGKAWSQMSGWINFRPTSSLGAGLHAGLPMGVQINSRGEFVGWAWTGGPYGGWIKFDCGTTGMCVKTDWRPIPFRSICNDSIDNDGDGAVDYPNDTGCDSLTDTDETNTIPSGGTGGGGGGGTYWYLPPLSTIQQPTIEPTNSANCSPYLLKYIKLGSVNDSTEVKKLEMFLNESEKENLIVNGIYEISDFEAVKRFQEKYRNDILGPWSAKQPTGYVYITTIAKINSLKCKDSLTCPYFTKYHKKGDIGGDVLRIQKFLNTIYSTQITNETGTFDDKTFEAVKRFQKDHGGAILIKWGLVKPTGYWYKTTRKRANEIIGCKEGPVELFKGVIIP